MPQTVITTNEGREKYAQYLAGEIPLAEATHIAWGDGGYDGTEVIDPDPSWVEVPGELLKKTLENKQAVDFVCEMEGFLETTDLVGEDISAAGIYDNDNDLIAVATFSPIPKGEEDEITFNWNTAF